MAFESGFFDLVLCNAVIQHLSPQDAETIAIPELARVLAPEAVLQLTFKVGSGVAPVNDSAYGTDGVAKSFQLYAEHRLLRVLEDCGCSMVEVDESGNLGGLLYINDPKPMRYYAFWVRKN